MVGGRSRWRWIRRTGGATLSSSVQRAARRPTSSRRGPAEAPGTHAVHWVCCIRGRLCSACPSRVSSCEADTHKRRCGSVLRGWGESRPHTRAASQRPGQRLSCGAGKKDGEASCRSDRGGSPGKAVTSAAVGVHAPPVRLFVLNFAFRRRRAAAISGEIFSASAISHATEGGGRAATLVSQLPP